MKYFGEGRNKAKFTLLNFAIIGGRDKGQRNLEDYEENDKTGSSGFYKFCFIVSLVVTKNDKNFIHLLVVSKRTRRILNNKEISYI